MESTQANPRKLIVFNMLTLDGYFEGPHQDIDWHTTDEEFNDFAVAQLRTIGAILFGRVTYTGMASYWPTEMAMATDPEVAGLMNSLPKVVFSKTLTTADWTNTTLLTGDLAQEVARLKQQPGQDLIILGSGTLVANMEALGLIDEYRVIINPVVLGAGTPLFRPERAPLRLKLLNSRVFKSGNVLLCYQPIRAG